MLMLRDNPDLAYRRITIDARIQSASQADLVRICLEQVVVGIGSAIQADERSDATRRSAGLTRAHAALIALIMGVDQTAPLAASLLQLYSSAREVILASVTRFDAEQLTQVRHDFQDIADSISRGDPLARTQNSAS